MILRMIVSAVIKLHPMNSYPSTILKKQKGFFIFEALVAIFIFVVGILGVQRIQDVSVESVSNAQYRSQAMYLTDSLVGRMWLDMSNLESYDTDVDAASRSPIVVAWEQEVARILPGVSSANQNTPVVQVERNGTRFNITVQVYWTPPHRLDDAATATESQILKARSNHVVQTSISPP